MLVQKAARNRIKQALMLLVLMLLPLVGFAQGTVVAWPAPVPVDLTDVTAISAGGYQGLAVKSDGTVVAWGDNNYGQTDVPVGLTDVTAVAGGYFHSLALKSDGTVVVWGSFGGENPPAELVDVIAISAGSVHSLALKSDGTVVAWGRETYGPAPAGLSGATAVSAGVGHSLVLKSDGTVIAWGLNYSGQTDVPVGLTGVVAIAAGWTHSLALKSDGTVVAWGMNNTAQATVPAGLTGVTAISAGTNHSLALQNPLTPEMAITDLAGYLNSQSLNASTKKSLGAKLNTALAALAAPNLPLACQLMQDFINQTKAQRGKKQITAAQADYLIAQASDIMLLIGCP